MGAHLILRIDADLKECFRRLAFQEGKTMSQKIIEMIEAYTKENDFGTLVDEVWKEIGQEIRGRGYLRKDVKRRISEVRGIGRRK